MTFLKTVTSLSTIEINKELICRYLGYGSRNAPDTILSLIHSQIERAYGLIKPIYTYTPKLIEGISGDAIFLAGSLKFYSETLSYVLSDCDWVFVFLVTIGKGLDERVTMMMEKGKIMEGSILDAIGSVAVEQAACKLQDDVEKEVEKKGYKATLRYSPGYCDWDVKQQMTIFKAIDSYSLGVHLTESCLMIPQKSISGIIGIGKFNGSKPSPCRGCPSITSCPYKRVRL